MSEPPAPRVAYVLRLVAQPGVDAVRALRLLLKRALRSYGLKCVDLREEQIADQQTEKDHEI
jgi:hypothetical protein